MAHVYKVVLLQLGVTLSLALALWAWQTDVGQAAMVGGLAVAIPNALLAFVASRRGTAEMVLVFGVVKFLLTLVLIALAMKILAPSPLGFFSGLIAVLVAHAVGGSVFSARTQV